MITPEKVCSSIYKCAFGMGDKVIESGVGAFYVYICITCCSDYAGYVCQSSTSFIVEIQWIFGRDL